MRIRAILPWPPIAGRGGSLLATTAVVALAVGGLPSGTASAEAAIAIPVVTLAGSLGTLPAGAATVVVRAELALHVDPHGVPQELELVPVASATITSRAFSIPVPDSAAVQRAEAQWNGVVNFNILVTSGTRQTSEFVPAALAVSSSTRNPVELAVRVSGQVRVPAFPAFSTQIQAATPAPHNGPTCNWYAYGSMYQQSTRIGEVHVANVPGVSDTFWFKNQNDMTISVGLSNTGPNSGYSYDGTIGLTNSLSANGSDTFGPGTVAYIDDTTNYQRYALEVEGHSCHQYMVQAVGSDADVYPGTGTPPRSPWGSCRNDPLHVTLAPGATWSRDQSRAAYYSSVASLFGFTFGASDGFTTNVEHDYVSHARQTTYICGDARGEAPGLAPVLYNTP